VWHTRVAQAAQGTHGAGRSTSYQVLAQHVSNRDPAAALPALGANSWLSAATTNTNINAELRKRYLQTARDELCAAPHPARHHHDTRQVPSHGVDPFERVLAEPPLATCRRPAPYLVLDAAHALPLACAHSGHVSPPRFEADPQAPPHMIRPVCSVGEGDIVMDAATPERQHPWRHLLHRCTSCPACPDLLRARA